MQIRFSLGSLMYGLFWQSMMYLRCNLNQMLRWANSVQCAFWNGITYTAPGLAFYSITKRLTYPVMNQKYKIRTENAWNTKTQASLANFMMFHGGAKMVNIWHYQSPLLLPESASASDINQQSQKTEAYLLVFNPCLPSFLSLMYKTYGGFHPPWPAA